MISAFRFTSKNYFTVDTLQNFSLFPHKEITQLMADGKTGEFAIEEYNHILWYHTPPKNVEWYMWWIIIIVKIMSTKKSWTWIKSMKYMKIIKKIILQDWYHILFGILKMGWIWYFRRESYSEYTPAFFTHLVLDKKLQFMLKNKVLYVLKPELYWKV